MYNELIAIYMGWVYDPAKGYWVNNQKDRPIPHWADVYNKADLSDLEYATSFDWLMPVVRKIQGSKSYNEWPYHIRSTPNMEETFSDVVRFIEWYNDENK